MNADEDAPKGAPEWILTYGDMMSLLLTIFVMLVSMGELKQTDKFQGVADSLHLQFGYDNAPLSMLPGELRPRNATLASLALAFRSKRQVAMQGENQVRTVAGESKRAQLIRPGDRTNVGAAIFFDESEAELSPQNQADLRGIADLLRGKPHKIEVRGHASQQLNSTIAGGDPWELAYRRARATMQFLVAELKIDPARIRISTAGPFEPLPLGPDPQKLRANPRVEVFLLEELTSDRVGAAPLPGEGNGGAVQQ